VKRDRNERLRIGIVVDTPIRAWCARAAALVAAADAVEETVVLPVTAPPPPAALAVHESLDARLSRLAGGALAPARPEEAGASRIGSAVTRAGLPQRVRELGLDLVIHLGSDVTEPEALAVEVWKLRHGGAAAGAPHVLVGELLEGDSSCISTLVRRSASADEVLYATRSLVRRLSLARTRDPVLWKGAELPQRALDLRMRGARQPNPPVVRAPAAAPPVRARDIARLEARLARKTLAYAWERLLKRWTWSIDWAECGEPAIEGSLFRPRGSLAAPVGRFFADPFVVGDGGRHYVFYEDFSRREGRASIAVAVVEGGVAHPGRPVVHTGHHLSYPFVFRAGGCHYLVPESAEAGVVQLFRATDFPYKWEPDTTLLSGTCVYDPTLLEHDGRWYLFAAVPAPRADADELHVFSADNLRGPYAPHPFNPVVSDVTCARPAGRIFRLGGRLLRPGQDGAGGYGAAVVLSEIRTLTPNAYEERLLTRITPDWARNARGTHTIDHDSGVQVMDVKQLEARWA
jgi:hypothetical protein